MKTRQQARLMRRSGCSTRIIAERLGISERHARRCTEDLHAFTSVLVGTPKEPQRWRFFHGIDGSQSKVARRFGVSRQRVHQALS